MMQTVTSENMLSHVHNIDVNNKIFGCTYEHVDSAYYFLSEKATKLTLKNPN